MRPSFRILQVALIAALAGAPASARAADAAPSAEAARIKADGDRLMDTDRYAEAAAAYAKGYALTADPVFLYNEGRALEALGDYPEAVARLERFVASATPAMRSKVHGLDAHIAELKGRIASLKVTSNVRGARLLVRSKAVGVLDPGAQVEVRAGPATIDVTADGYEPWHREIDLPARRVTVVDVQLRSKVAGAILSVRSTPAGANVFVDGKGFGRAPLEGQVTPGTHGLRLELDGYEDETFEVTLRNHERRDVDVPLKSAGSITSRWWFWAGLGVLVAGGATATTLLIINSEKKPETGDFSPGQIPAGLTIGF